MINDFNITAKKYLFDRGLLLEERNFFNYINVPTLSETLELNQYLLDVGELQFSYDEADDNVYSMLPSEVNFTVSSLTSTITNFFELYTNALYYRYIIEIKYNGTLIWKGIINPDTFKQSFRPSPDSYKLSFTAFGMEKEFSDYFKTKFLETPDVTVSIDDALNVQYCSFLPLLKAVFNPTNNNILYEAETNISNFRVAFDDALIQSKTSDFYPHVFVKTGLNNIIDLKETKWDWFKRTLCSMGWVFYFRGDTMVIKNRRSYLGANYNVTSSVLLEWDYTKQYATRGYNHVLIEDSYDEYGGSGLGTYTGGDFSGKNAMGQRGYLFSDLSKHLLYTTPFNTWQINGILGSSNYLWNYIIGQEINTFEEADNITNGINANVTSSGWVLYYTGAMYGLNQDRILKLDVGKAKGRLNTQNPPALNGYNFYNPNDKTFPLYKVTDTAYGNALYRYNGTKYTTYQDYMRSSQARYNFESLLQSKTLKGVTAKIKGLLFDNKADKFFFDSTELSVGDGFAVKTISYDIINEVTTLQLEQNV